MRCIGQYCWDNLSLALPRLRRAHIQQWTGLTGLQPADGPRDALYGATLSATALANLDGRSLPVLEARRACIEVAGSRLSGAELAQLLGVADRTVYTLKRRSVDADLVRAIRLQLGYRKLTAGSDLPKI